MSYSALANSVYEKLIKYNELDGWKIAKKIGNAQVLYQSSPDFDGYIYKLDCHLNAPPAVVFDHVFPVNDDNMDLRLKWDKSLEMLEKIEEYEKDVFVTRAQVKGSLMGLVAGREFVDVTKVTKKPGSYVLHLEPGKTRLFHYIQADLGGKLPHSLVHAALPSNLVAFYNNLSKAVNSNGGGKAGS